MDITMFSTILYLLFISTTLSHSLPVNVDSDEHRQTHEQIHSNTNTMTVSEFDSFEDVSNFLRIWFNRIKSRLLTQGARDVTRSRNRRDTFAQLDISNNSTDEEAFEEYEREYIIQQTMNDLKTLYYHNEYMDYLNSKKMRDKTHRKPSALLGTTVASPIAQPTPSDGPDFSRVDPMLEEKLRELRNLDARELDRIFRNVRRAVEDGVADNSIASLCCQMTG